MNRCVSGIHWEFWDKKDIQWDEQMKNIPSTGAISPRDSLFSAREWPFSIDSPDWIDDCEAQTIWMISRLDTALFLEYSHPLRDWKGVKKVWCINNVWMVNLRSRNFALNATVAARREDVLARTWLDWLSMWERKRWGSATERQIRYIAKLKLRISETSVNYAIILIYEYNWPAISHIRLPDVIRMFCRWISKTLSSWMSRYSNIPSLR